MLVLQIIRHVLPVSVLDKVSMRFCFCLVYFCGCTDSLSWAAFPAPIVLYFRVPQTAKATGVCNFCRLCSASGHVFASATKIP